MRTNRIGRTVLRTCARTAATAATLAVVGMGLAGAAAAADTGNAQDTITGLQARGFNVRINGTADGPMSECTVTGVHGMSNSNVDAAGHLIDPTQFTTVYVDISCPDDH